MCPRHGQVLPAGCPTCTGMWLARHPVPGQERACGREDGLSLQAERVTRVRGDQGPVLVASHLLYTITRVLLYAIFSDKKLGGGHVLSHFPTLGLSCFKI